MEDFFTNMFDKKGKLLIGLGGSLAAVGLIGYLYKKYTKYQDQIQEKVEEQFDFDSQIKKLKQSINVQNPSLEDVKKILAFSFELSKGKASAFNESFNKDRKKYTKQTRNQNLDQYLKMIIQSTTQIQQTSLNIQQQIMTKIGVSQYAFVRYQNDLGPFIQQQMTSQGSAFKSSQPMTVEQARNAINLQIAYINKNQDQIVEKLINASSGWTPQQKAYLSTIVFIYIADQSFDAYPYIDIDGLQSAQIKYQYQLQNQLTKFQQALTSVMQKLTQKLGFGGYEQQEQVGGHQGINQMQMSAMQQIDQLRLQNPAAFQQMMMMMNKGMK